MAIQNTSGANEVKKVIDKVISEKDPQVRTQSHWVDLGEVIKGGEIQTVPTSGTTTITQEMADILSDRSSSPQQNTPSSSQQNSDRDKGK